MTVPPLLLTSLLESHGVEQQLEQVSSSSPHVRAQGSPRAAGGPNLSSCTGRPRAAFPECSMTLGKSRALQLSATEGQESPTWLRFCYDSQSRREPALTGHQLCAVGRALPSMPSGSTRSPRGTAFHPGQAGVELRVRPKGAAEQRQTQAEASWLGLEKTSTKPARNLIDTLILQQLSPD